MRRRSPGLGRLLDQADDCENESERGAFDLFRRGLLKHIAMEEKILLPMFREVRGGEPFAAAGRLRLDHGAIAALLVPPPSPLIVAAIKKILSVHDPIEEDPGGLYDACDRAAGAQMNAWLARLFATPEVPVAAYSPSPRAIAGARVNLKRAGYDPAMLGPEV